MLDNLSMYVFVFHLHISCLFLLKGPENNDTQWNEHAVPRSWFLITFLHQKEPGLLGEMCDSRARAGKLQDKPGTAFCTRKQRSVQRALRSCQRDIGANLIGTPLAKSETI